MTLDEAIKHCEEVAEAHTKFNSYGGYESCDECGKDHRQLAEWLKELQEAKRLLKEVVGDLNATVAEVYNGGLLCKCCKWKSQTGECCCPSDGGCDVAYQWRYADEAEKLLKDEELIM